MEQSALEALVRRCQQTLPDDTRAFEQLVALYKDRIFATAYRIMDHRQEAEDQTQEIFVKVYRHIRRLDDPATFNSWIYRIAANTCYDALTQQRRRPATQPLAPIMPDGDEEPRYADERIPTPEEAALRRELRRCLEAALAELDTIGRTALVLRDIEDRSYQEIADALAIGLSAVKMRVHRTRLAFQQMLDRVCPGVARPTSASDGTI
jgi:RNA polymerase sigma-70 factor (ECF subfamily)